MPDPSRWLTNSRHLFRTPNTPPLMFHSLYHLTISFPSATPVLRALRLLWRYRLPAQLHPPLFLASPQRPLRPPKSPALKSSILLILYSSGCRASMLQFTSGLVHIHAVSGVVSQPLGPPLHPTSKPTNTESGIIRPFLCPRDYYRYRVERSVGLIILPPSTTLYISSP